ncbi:hypothetical protein [Aristaeella hokkaidonensis]|uniref:Uncharacterized protein n=1 Tax=Aristaeella hokkaidonensis TaxID=3046382 RepID=A0AC61MV77_9FIRM|nr:hypothetical protein [Aristaeella hokkaidonensis]QUC66380.1 hypothetical protein JYE49_10985 [Aristaeella hokkaidonensis]SNT94209.1 hypothetical protein SAMN06297421_104181 [Aristaeella hokkaidonensis]
MKKIHRIAAIALLIPLLFMSYAGGESIVSGIDIGSIYDSLVISFELEKYDDVISAYESNTALATYKDTDMYYRFSMAQSEIGRGNFEVAAYLFKGLSDFNNSALWYAYAMARLCEQKQHYDEAIEFYTTASSLPETDSISRMKDCLRKISAEEQQARYLDAVSIYENATQNKDSASLNLCLNIFSSMEEYKDAPIYAKKCRDLIAQLERTIVLNYHATVNGETISWTDTDEGKEYTVSVCESNSLDEILRFDCTNQSFELTDLIPGTNYTVTVMDSTNCDVLSNCSFSIPAADRMSRQDIRFRHISLVGIDKQVLEYSGESFEKLYNKKPALFISPEDYTISSLLLENTVFCFIVSMEYTGEKDTTISVMSVLRSENNGVKKTEENNLVINEKMFMITMDLDNLMQQFVNSPYNLKTDSYRYELYIDGQICAEYNFSIEGR